MIIGLTRLGLECCSKCEVDIPGFWQETDFAGESSVVGIVRRRVEIVGQALINIKQVAANNGQ